MGNAREATKISSKPTLTKEQKFLCAAIGSQADLPFAHPFETIAKREQDARALAAKVSHDRTLDLYKKILAPGSNFFKNFKGLYRGVGWSSFNKFSSRTFRYLGQDFTQEKLQENFLPQMSSFVGEKKSKAILGGLSGLFVSSVETISLYPLDVIKTRVQLNGGTSEIYHHLYKGLLPTLVRNSFSSMVFFSSYNYFLSKEKHKSENHFAASLSASLVTTTLNNPIEVVKIRLQSPRVLNQAIGVKEIVAHAWAKEGMKGFFMDGLAARCIQSPIKMAFPFLVFTHLKKKFEEKNEREKLKQSSFPPSRLP